MKTLVLRCLLIGAAGFFGAIARYLLAVFIGRINITFPLGTFFINITGCLLLGWFLSFTGARNVSDLTRLAIGVGFVGAYTTFSTFIYESTHLAEQGARLEAAVNIVASLGVGILAYRLGEMLGRWA